MENKIVYVDDNPNSKAEFMRFFSDSYPLLHFEDAEQCLDAFQKQTFPVILSINELKKIKGLELLFKIQTIAPETLKILLTGNGIKDLSNSPFPVFSLGTFRTETLTAIKEFVDRALRQLHEFPDERLFKGKNIPDVVGRNPALLANFDFAKKIASLKDPVLITGETGTGKDVISKFIHYSGDRKGKPLQFVNCAAISSELFESEFFGHTKGAYTGAVENNEGHFVKAEEGTLVLDEISEINIKHQAKLLRAIDNQEIYPVGSQKVKLVDVRIIAVSNRDLMKGIEKAGNQIPRKCQGAAKSGSENLGRKESPE